MKTNLSSIVRAGSACPLFTTAALALAITLTLGSCEEKESGKSSSSAVPSSNAAEGLPSAEVSALPNYDNSGFLSDEEASMVGSSITAEEAAANALASCGKGGGSGVKLPECIITNGNPSDCDLAYKFEYDDKNRIVKNTTICFRSSNKGEIEIFNFSTTTITYNTYDLITVERVSHSDNSKSVAKYAKYAIKGNTITRTGELYEPGTLTIDKYGYIAKYNENTYQYKGGNLTKYSDSPISYGGFDDKKSPFSNCATPKWLIQDLIDASFANKNNALGWGYDNPEPDQPGIISAGYHYEYDSDGFPTKKSEDTEDGTMITSYTYLGKGNTK